MEGRLLVFAERAVDDVKAGEWTEFAFADELAHVDHPSHRLHLAGEGEQLGGQVLGPQQCLLGAVEDGKVRLVAGVTKDVTDRVKAGALVGEIPPLGEGEAPAEDAIDLDALLERLGDELGARLLIASDDPAVRARGTWSLALPANLPEWLMPIVSIVPGQLHARHVTVAKGGDPEQPRSIAKVTRTT
mgnify:CR=1 FL=1